MVNTTLIETILREQDKPGCSTTRQIRDIYNNRSNEDPIIQHTDEDKEFQKILLNALEAFPIPDDEDEDEPISYTVKLKDSDDGSTPKIKKQKMIVKVMKHQVIQKSLYNIIHNNNKTIFTTFFK